MELDGGTCSKLNGEAAGVTGITSMHKLVPGPRLNALYARARDDVCAKMCENNVREYVVCTGIRFLM